MCKGFRSQRVPAQVTRDRSLTVAAPFCSFAALCSPLAALAMSMLAAGCAGSSQRPPTAQAPAAQTTPAPAKPTLDEQSRLASVVEGVEPWEFEGRAGKIITTAHYRLFTTEKDPITVDRAPRFLEVALEHYRTALAPTGAPLPPPPLRLETMLMDNRAQWKAVALQMLGPVSSRYFAIQRGGFATGGRAFLYDIGVFDTLAIAAHEGWHQYTQRTFAEPMPIWLEEGLATYMEGHKWEGSTPRFLPWANIERFDQLRAAQAKGELLPLDRLLATAPQDLLMHAGDAAVNYYAQVWALVHFLAEGAGGAHRGALEALLSDFASGRGVARVSAALGRQAALTAVMERRGDGVFRAYFGADVSALGAEYEEFMRRLVRPGSRGPIVAGVSPLGGQ